MLSDTDEGESKIARQEIIKLAMPALAEQILLTFVLIASTAVVSHLGKSELLATTWNGNLFNLFMTYL